MGALVTLDLPEDSPAMSLPWIITFGPLSDDDEWEPVVCGPYERPHALALAEEVIADAELMAVVEPVMPHVSVEKIREEIATAREMAAEERAAADGEESDVESGDLEIEFDEEEDLADEDFEDEDEDEDEDDEEFEEEDDEDLDEEDDEDLEDFEDEEEDDEDGHDGHDHGAHDPHERLSGYESAPTPEEIRAGFARIAERLTSEYH